MYTITLSDGTLIEGLQLRDNILWSVKELTRDMFAGKLNGVKITQSVADGEDDYDYDGLTGEHAHMDVVYIRHYAVEGRYALALRDVPEREYLDAKRDGDIEYLAMMMGVEL